MGLTFKRRLPKSKDRFLVRTETGSTIQTGRKNGAAYENRTHA